MKVQAIETGILMVNTYIIINEKKGKCVIVDPGAEFEKIKKYLDDNKLKAEAVLLTHGHFDHIGAVCELQELGIPVYIHYADEGFTNNPRSAGFPEYAKYVKHFTADHFVNDGEVLKLAGFDVEVIHTPGHTKGGTTYRVENALFTGDTLFSRSIGRTDLEGGNYNEIIQSIRGKLFKFSGMTVYPGHSEFTDIDSEKKENPYCKID